MNLTNSIKNKMRLAMGAFCLIITVQLVVSSLVLDQINSIAALKDQIHTIEVKAIDIHNNNINFFYQETQNPDYFLSGRSEYLWRTKRLDKQVKHQLSVLMNDPIIEDMDLKLYVKRARIDFYKYQTYFNEIVVKTRAMGFAESGLVGKLNENMDELQAINKDIREDLLEIRTSEMNFMLRSDPEFADRALEKSNLLIGEMHPVKHEVERELLADYITTFSKYVELSKEIGLNNTSGLKKALFMESAKLDKELLNLTVKFDTRYEKQMDLLNFILLGSAFFIILFSIILSFMLSKNLSQPIVLLVNKIKGALLEDGDQVKLPNNTPKEIKTLDREFNALLEQVQIHVDEIEQKKGELETQNTELVELTKELDYFIYHTSHDIRAPLTSISGLIEVAEHAKEGQLKEYFEHMKICLNQLDTTIIEIIHFYKNRSEDLTYSEVEISVSLSNALNGHSNAYVEGEVELKIDQDLRVVTDSFRLELILSAILSNALRYKDKHKSNHLVEVTCTSGEHGVEIEVKDNGIGISEKQMPNIFEMFYRASDLSTGSGLGLYVAKQSAERLNAEINMESKVGVGTRVKIFIPEMRSNLNRQELTSTVQN